MNVWERLESRETECRHIVYEKNTLQEKEPGEVITYKSSGLSRHALSIPGNDIMVSTRWLEEGFLLLWKQRTVKLKRFFFFFPRHKSNNILQHQLTKISPVPLIKVFLFSFHKDFQISRLEFMRVFTPGDSIYCLTTLPIT